MMAYPILYQAQNSTLVWFYYQNIEDLQDLPEQDICTLFELPKHRGCKCAEI